MPEMPGDEFAHIVATFPRQFGSQLAFYFNGTFVHTLHARRKNRNPQFGPDGNEVEIDDSNCLLAENGGRLQPGVLLESRCDADGEESVADGVAANAGLAVTKDGEIRLTCPSHLFDGQNSKVCFHGNVIVGELDKLWWRISVSSKRSSLCRASSSPSIVLRESSSKATKSLTMTSSLSTAVSPAPNPCSMPDPEQENGIAEEHLALHTHIGMSLLNKEYHHI
jgi:hypothetical protein